jgi:DNA-binding protein H-NS
LSQYAKLKDQIARLQEEADQVRRQEIADVVAEIHAKMAEYGLSAADLGFVERAKRGRPPKKLPPAAKYRDPQTGATWTGRGKPPAWIIGKDRERFLID